MSSHVGVGRLFGLIGFPLSHSFSKKYFTEKFAREGITNSAYELFPIARIDELGSVIAANPNLIGLNVTIPYKQQVIPFLDELEESARRVGAVNTIAFRQGRLIGYNTDVYGFGTSLNGFLAGDPIESALVLGTGGASKAVCRVLEQMNMPFQLVSRTSGTGHLTYDRITPSDIRSNRLIINTTPLGMTPEVDRLPEIPYAHLTSRHYLFDLIYNPEVTRFLQTGAEFGASVRNGMEMLILQAEQSWSIWNETNAA